MKISKPALIGLFLLICFSCESKKKEGNDGKNETSEQVETINKKIGPADFKAKIENKEVQLLDVRTPEEFADGHLKNASNIDFYNDNFLEQTSGLDRSKPVYLYCRSGGRSGKAAKKLSENGYQVYDLEGGILAWEAENFEVVKDE